MKYNNQLSKNLLICDDNLNALDDLKKYAYKERAMKIHIVVGIIIVMAILH